MAYLIRDCRDPGQFSPAYFAQSKYMVICGPEKEPQILESDLDVNPELISY